MELGLERISNRGFLRNRKGVSVGDERTFPDQRSHKVRVRKAGGFKVTAGTA